MAKSLSKLSMKLFGLPYQFPKAVDPRVNSISGVVGKKFTENILLEAPICTIIPGEPEYLPGKKQSKKVSTASALIEGVNGNFSALSEIYKDNKEENLRLYDFKNNYTDYMKYVNVLCRAGAVFLELTDEFSVGTKKESFAKFDWRNYRWDSTATMSMVSRIKNYKQGVVGKLTGQSGSAGKYEFVMESDDGTEGDLDQILKNYNYVQFYVDPDVSPSENLTNSTTESMMKSVLDQGSGVMKDLAFMANSGGIDTTTLNTFTEGSAAALQSGISEILGDNAVSGALSRIVNLGGSVLQGHSIVIPSIYQSSSYTKSYSITIHLKTPYGTKLGYYMDIFVPMMHLLALTMPRQESANSFSSPFLVKAYVDGLFSCNLGLVDSINITKSTESFSVSGLPNEVDVTLNITDLYSDLSMSPSNDPIRFANNSSLIEYLATSCGMSLTAPNFEKKWGNIINTVTSSFTDIPASIKSSVEESIYSMLADFTTLYR